MMVFTVEAQKELADIVTEIQINKAIKKMQNKYKRQVIGEKVARYIKAGVDPEVAKVMAKVEFEYGINR